MDLPDEMWILIIKELDFKDMLRLSFTSKKLDRLCKSVRFNKVVLVGCYYPYFEKLKKDWKYVKFNYDLTWLDKMNSDFTFETLIS